MESIVSMALGYAFIVIVSRLAGPDAIGTASVMATLGMIFSSIANLGIPWVLPKFLGSTLNSTQRRFEFGSYYGTSLTISMIVMAASTPILFALDSWLSDHLKLSPSVILMAIFVMDGALVANILRAALVSVFNSKWILYSTIIGSSTKLLIAVLLIWMGQGIVAASYGYLAYYVASLLVLIPSAIIILRKEKMIQFRIVGSKAKELIGASLSSWIPSIVILLGNEVGLIVVFTSNGAANAGIYYVSLTIYSAITAISSSLMTLSLPVISGKSEDRERLSWRVIRLGLISSMPLSTIVFFFPQVILGLLGSQFQEVYFPLMLLMLSVLPFEFSKGATNLAFANNKYRFALYIGLATNVPRFALYLALVPYFGSAGASISFLVGSITGLLVSFILTNRMALPTKYKDLALISGIPFGLGMPFYFLQISFIFAWPAILALSLILYIRLNLLDSTDITDLSFAVLPKSKANKCSALLNGLVVKIKRI